MESLYGQDYETSSEMVKETIESLPTVTMTGSEKLRALSDTIDSKVFNSDAVPIEIESDK